MTQKTPYKLANPLYSTLILLITTLAYCTAAIAQEAYNPKAYQVVFKLETQGISAGKMTMSLENNNGLWLATSKYKPSFIAKLFKLEKSTEITKFTYQNGKTLIAEYQMNIGEESNTVSFDHSTNTYNESNALPENAHTNQTILSALSNDILLNKTQSTYVIFNKEQFKDYTVTYQYNQKIKINGKNVNTVKVAISKDNRTSIFWLAEKWNWAPIRFEKHKNDTIVVKGSFKHIQI